MNPGSGVQAKLVDSFVIIFAIWLSRLILIQFVNRRVVGVRRRHSLRKTISYVMAFMAVLLLSPLWIENLQGMATFLGLVSAGLAIALQGPLSNLAGWLYLIWRRPFEIGDRIEIGGTGGDVIDISLFQFTLLEIGNWVHADQSTGRVVYIPNRKIFDHHQANYTKGFDYIWHELEITITFESNWQKAKEILGDIATRDAANLSTDAAEHIRRAAQRFAIVYSKLTPIVYLKVIDYGVLLTIRYLCEPRHRRSTEQAIWEDILQEFAAHPDIQFAYPTQRFYQRNVEFTPQPALRPAAYFYKTAHTRCTSSPGQRPWPCSPQVSNFSGVISIIVSYSSSVDKSQSYFSLNSG
jgi:small-conductance mechanosensitive channel